MNLLIIGIAIIIVVKIIASLPKQAVLGSSNFRKTQFMTDAEVRFYKVLSDTIGGKYKLFAKPRLGDIVSAENHSRSAWQTSTNKLNMKHADFLLCDPASLSSVCVIELDDSSHTRNDRQSRDNFVNDVLAKAGIPIVHIPVRASYTIAEISHKLGEVISDWNPVQVQPAKTAQEPPPQKPRGVLLTTEPPPLHKDIKYMPPSLRTALEKKASDGK